VQTSTLLYIVLALLLSIAIAFFQYFYKTKNTSKTTILLFSLRAISLFLIGLLFINPKITTTLTENIKPVLSVLVDNSLSTKYFKEEAYVKQIVKELQQNKDLTNKFEVDYFSFGKDVEVLDSLTFNQTHTDISKAIQSVAQFHKNKVGTTLLISDGNQTIGNDYEFLASKEAIYPLIIGDTTSYQDVRIAQLNVNKYSYINNKFPVEVLLFYEGDKEVSTTFTITQAGKKVFSKKVSFSPKQKTTTVIANLKATKEGIQYFTAGVAQIKNEKNTKNNYKSFAVEVIDEQSQVLLLSSVLHPDLGALKKAIESNKQRKATISLVNKFKGNLNDFSLVIFYQPNASFKKWMNQRKSNFILVSGTRTDWKFINSLEYGLNKEALRQDEYYSAGFNTDFTTFLQKNIHFNDFPPLQDKFGEVNVTGEFQPLLYQKLKGIDTQQPLLATFEKTDVKWSAILGEGIWKWRSHSFLEENSFEKFDNFIGNLVQYTSSNKKRKRLDVTIKRLYPANSVIDIAALYLDKNYQFDNRANLQLTITNLASKDKKVYPFSLVNNTYKVSLQGLPSGNYAYKVTVEGQNLQKSGRFKITDYQVEEQFTNANFHKLKKLADKTKGKLYYKNQVANFVKDVVSNKQYYTTQKEITKQENLINWQWLLFTIVGLLALEWFIRKYTGKI